MSPRIGQVLDEYDRPVPGAKIYVYDQAGNEAALTSDGASSIDQPLITDQFGAYSYFAADGVYREDTWFGGKRRFREILQVGPLPTGPPGGNVMAIGLFTALAALSIPLGTDIVRTAGHSTAGVGVADYVADAAVDAAYAAAHPLTSSISANGRGFRIDASKGLSLPQTGGKADSSVLAGGAFNGTDNLAAYNAAKAALVNGGTLHAPQGAGAYRFSARPSHTEGICLVGDGWHENPGTVGVTTYIGIRAYPGTVFCFDADVAGPIFYDFTSNNANAQAYQYQGARYSIVENVMFYGGGGTSVTAHGFEARTAMDLRNVRIENFAGNGVHINASTAGAVPYGNADKSTFTNVRSNSNKCHGWYINGNDANIMSFFSCEARVNGGCGVLDKSPAGNNYYGFHAATNNQSFGAGTTARTQVIADAPQLSDQYVGSFVTINGGAAEHLFSGCYVEGGAGYKAEITNPALIIGGLLSEAGALTAASTATVLNAGAGLTIANIIGRGDLTLHHGSGGHVYVVNDAGGTAIIEARPGAGTFSNARLTGNTNSIANGLDILAGGGAGYLSADTIVHRNAAQTITFNTSDASGFNINTGALKVAGTQVVGARGAAVADAVAAAAAPTQAEFNAFVTQFNAWLARARAHGLIT